MFGISDLIGNIVNLDEVENVNYDPNGLTKTTKASKASGHIMAEVLLWGLTSSGLDNSGPCDLWGKAENYTYAQEPKMTFWVQAQRKPLSNGSCFNYTNGGRRTAPKRGSLYAKSQKDGDLKEATEYSPQKFLEVGSIKFKGQYKKNTPNNPLQAGLITDEIDAVISIEVKRNKVAGLIYNAKDWLDELAGNKGMPSASDFHSAYKDDIIGKIKFDNKAFFEADVTNFKGINGLLGADVFG